MQSLSAFPYLNHLGEPPLDWFQKTYVLSVVGMLNAFRVECNREEGGGLTPWLINNFVNSVLCLEV